MVLYIWYYYCKKIVVVFCCFLLNVKLYNCNHYYQRTTSPHSPSVGSFLSDHLETEKRVTYTFVSNKDNVVVLPLKYGVRDRVGDRAGAEPTVSSTLVPCPAYVHVGQSVAVPWV